MKESVKALIYEHIVERNRANNNKPCWIPAVCSKKLWNITATEYGECLRELEQEHRIIKTGHLVKAI